MRILNPMSVRQYFGTINKQLEKYPEDLDVQYFGNAMKRMLTKDELIDLQMDMDIPNTNLVGLRSLALEAIYCF